VGVDWSTKQLPGSGLRWELSGAGLENLAVARRTVAPPGPGELLMRVDACGICFSDIKVLNLGGQHPRLVGRDLAAEPVVMGHETAMTVVAVGSDLRDRYAPGSRFIIQADVYSGGQNMAFGYRLAGGYSQFQTVGREILDGDEGCYLIPVAGHLGYSQAALCEPWACVEAAYAFQPRPGPRPGGACLCVDGTADPETTLEAARREFPAGVDDVLVQGEPSAGLIAGLQGALKPGGALAFGGGDTQAREAGMDVGSVHYRGHWLTRAEGDLPDYPWGRSCELAPGGRALFIGAGGPLGQMHLQRALSLPRPPRRIVVSQRGGPRLDALRERFEDRARQRGIEWILLDARELGEKFYDRALAESGGRGFDDVVTIAPDLTALACGFRLLAPGGGLNVFAGVPVGSRIPLDLARIYREDVRLWGTSGSTIADLARIVARVESGTLDTDRVVAAVGGIGAVADGLAAVRDGRFVGKTVIYPGIESLPLTPVAELAKRHLGIAAKLTEARFWNAGAEAELFRLYG
jgi:threonine dehydrogenase-like Zn-dependent dehydrogenase